MEEDKRLLVWLRPGNNPEDGKALDIMERLPRRSRGEFYRKALVIASALHELDPRLINLLAAQTTTSFNAETLKQKIGAVFHHHIFYCLHGTNL